MCSRSKQMHAAFEDIAHVERAPDRLAQIGEGRAAADDKGAGDAREVGGEALRHTIDEVVLLWIAADIGEGQHHNREPSNVSRRSSIRL